MTQSKEDSKRVVAPQVVSQTELQAEQSLRPVDLSEVIGRKREKHNISVMVQSARKRKASMDHVLFHGPPGLGKTSLAMVIATEMGVPMHVTTGPAISKAGELASILTSLQPKSVLFIDEVHRLRHAVEEILYPAMEDRAIDVVIGKGPGARTLRLDLPEFTIIAATTKLSMLSAPLRDRFGVDFRLDFYTPEELALIVEQKADKMKIRISKDAADEIASRSRLTARVAVRILKRARDLAVVEGTDQINQSLTRRVLEMLNIDQLGLDETDRQILNAIYHKFSNQPVGLKTLSASISSDESTVEDVYEPYLLRSGLLQRTSRGRVLTQRAIEYIQSQHEQHQN